MDRGFVWERMLRKIEWGVAILLTGLAVCLHVVFMRHAGALWRDEVSTLNLATMPHLPEVWGNLHYDSFPVFWVMVLRVWAGLGLAGDQGLRLLGFLVGILVLVALWFNARVFKISLPIISLFLLGLCPTLIIWGDSMRAWGWGVLWILLTLGLVWRVTESAGVLNVTLAALAAIASVQSIYYNSVMLFAVCVGGVVVAARRRSWKTVVAVLGIGLAAAISLLPYLGVFQRGANNYLIMRRPYGVERFVGKIAEAIAIPGTSIVAIWGLLFLMGAGVVIFCRVRPEVFKATPAQRDLLYFSTTTLAAGLAAYFVFLANLRLPTQPWYYAALLAVAAVTLDAMLSVAANQANGRLLRLAFAVVVPAMVFLPVWRLAQRRMTNANVLAKTLAQSAVKGDLIVMNPWYCGASFDHYYAGAAAWVGLPDVKDYKLQRFDKIKEMMIMPEPSDAIRDVLEKMEATLKSGKRLWLVAGPIDLRTGAPAAHLLPAPSGPSRWYFGYYVTAWSKQAGAFVGAHAKDLQAVDLATGAPVNPMEDLKLIVVEGWREN